MTSNGCASRIPCDSTDLSSPEAFVRTRELWLITEQLRERVTVTVPHLESVTWQDAPVDFHPKDRAPDAFQQQLTAQQVEVLCRRAFGAETRVRSATELGLGGYNTTYRVELATGPVILRVAPEPARQTRIEREFMRNEYFAAPYFAPIAPLLPRTLAADFTHQAIGRDYVVQAVLDGRPGPEVLPTHERAEHGPYFRQLGTITRAIHDVRGPGFGVVAGPHFARWSEALVAYFAVRPQRPLLWLPTGLLVGGAIGNLIDRISNGSVTDFIKLPFWPAFNISDMAITFGVLVLLYVLEGPHKGRESASMAQQQQQEQ